MRVPRTALSAAMLAGGLGLATAGCATIVQGKHQEVSISSSPTGAQVVVDSSSVGDTPVVVKLTRKNKHTIRIALEGYQPYDLITTRGTSGWVWGNIVFGGLIGLIVDASTGAFYEVKPEMVQATLSRGSAQVQQTGDLLVVRVVLAPEAGWRQIGTLQPVE